MDRGEKKRAALSDGSHGLDLLTFCIHSKIPKWDSVVGERHAHYRPAGD